MRIHLLEHDPFDLSNTNINAWARQRGYPLVHTYVCSDEELPDIDAFDWLMVMGGSPHVWETERYPWLAAEKALIGKALESGKWVLGICFGAQLLAEALGGEVSTNRHREIGWHEVTLTAHGRDSFLFRDVPERFTTFHWHSDHFSLPPGGTRLAESRATPNQAFAMEGRPVVGLQFHPEYTRDMVTRFAHMSKEEWAPGRFVPGAESVLAQTPAIPETDWLMTGLLDNMERKFIGR